MFGMCVNRLSDYVLRILRQKLTGTDDSCTYSTVPCDQTLAMNNARSEPSHRKN